MSADVQSARPADIPSLDRLLSESAFQQLLSQYARTQVTAALRAELEQLRLRGIAGELDTDALKSVTIVARTGLRLAQIVEPQLRAVFNMTGTVLHTNLGRGPLPEEEEKTVMRTLTTAVNLEFNLSSGERGDRDEVVESLLRELCGAEAATIVNNNAAAVLLILNTLAKRREVLVSRGELVEIGGAFRIPDVMRSAGAKLIEVGTTNRTHPSDYADAMGAKTALVMKVHTSNYAISGFTAQVDIGELAQLGRSRKVPVAVDLGSGSLVNLQAWGLPKEPTVREAIAAGADLVAFSADKLLGGPQAGIIVGRSDLISRLKKNPLKRALRVGKLTLAALEPVLALYRAPEFLAQRLTTLRLLSRSAEQLELQTRRLLPTVQAALGTTYSAIAMPMSSQIGSGALPIDLLPSYGFCVRTMSPRQSSVISLQAKLRGLPRPIIGRIADKALWLDMRCIEAADEAEFIAQWASLRQ
jgi:L-seryl-tRNA(Ser) seleniumtransferase